MMLRTPSTARSSSETTQNNWCTTGTKSAAEASQANIGRSGTCFLTPSPKIRSDGALVRLITPISPGELERDADRRLLLFMQDLLPHLQWLFAVRSRAKFTGQVGPRHCRNRHA